MEREEGKKEIKNEPFHWWENPNEIEEIRKINESLCKIHREIFSEFLYSAHYHGK